MNDINVDILHYLEHPEEKEALFERARAEREARFGSEVFAYGFDYFSTYCRNECAFCLYRNGNNEAPRYRHETDNVVRTAVQLAESGVHVIDLTMGEDPRYVANPEMLAELVESVRKATGRPIMLSPGVVDPESLPMLLDAGVTWLALYQETFDRQAYANLRRGQDFDVRLNVKKDAVETGLLVEEGLLTGWGDTAAQAAASLVEMDAAQPSQVRAMTFVPQAGTPLANLPARSSERELIMIALMRLLYPEKLIPASLDVEGPAGLLARLNAGANVITSIISPGFGLEGVARNRDIEDGGRTLAQIAPTIEQAGLALASQSRYESLVTEMGGTL